jgi:alkylation response protein AidB-like acyl-CoA dehydrogenase
MTATLLDAVDGILDTVRANTEVIDRERRLPDTVVDAVRSTGLNRALLPTELGGTEDVLGFLEAVERIAAADGSTGWCACIGGGSNLFGAYVGEPAAREIFAVPDAAGAGVFAPLGSVVPTDGTLRLTGRWPFASNCLHASHIGLAGFLHDEQGNTDPVPRYFLLPMTDVTIHDTWDVRGLRGTGSNDVSVTDLEVDLSHACTFMDQPWPSGAMWRVPLFSLLGPTLAAVMLGVAQGAVDLVLEHARAKQGGGLRGPVGDDSVALSDLTTAYTAVRAARSGMHDEVRASLEIVAKGDRMSPEQQARTILAAISAGETAVAAISTAHQLGGGRAAYAGNPLLRALNDVHTGRQHIFFARANRVVLGKALIGAETFAPPFIT